MNLYAEHADGLAELQAELGGDCPSFVWKDKSILCLPGGAHRLGELGAGGLGFDADLSLTVLVAAFGLADTDSLVKALLKSRLTYQGHIYRVEEAAPAPGEFQITIKCTDLNKGLGTK